MIPSCPDCRNSYQGNDLLLRCRVHSNGLKCSPAAADDCRKFEREPGADAEDSHWVRDWLLCDQGRAD